MVGGKVESHCVTAWLWGSVLFFSVFLGFLGSLGPNF